MRILAISTACMLAVPSAFAQVEDNAPSIADLDFLIGAWEGQTTFFFPRDNDREPAHEEADRTCQYILANNYIQCDSTMTRSDGRSRSLRSHFNYDPEETAYQALYIYDNWAGHVTYHIRRGEEANTYVAFMDYTTPEGVAADERIEWRLSEDGRKWRVSEFHHLPTDPDGYWAKNFEVDLRRAD